MIRKTFYGTTDEICVAIALTGSLTTEERDQLTAAKQDESGTPFCVTVDHQTIEDGTVTLRDRDTTKQERVKASDLSTIIAECLHI